jgi:hypothetical protein
VIQVFTTRETSSRKPDTVNLGPWWSHGSSSTTVTTEVDPKREALQLACVPKSHGMPRLPAQLRTETKPAAEGDTRNGRRLALPFYLRHGSCHLHLDGDRQPGVRISSVVQVIPVVIVNVEVIGVVPIIGPVFRPGVYHQEPKAAIRETRVTHIDRGLALHPEPVSNPERNAELLLGDVITAVASPLGPGAMVAGPVLRTILLPGTVPLPSATLLQPAPLLLPGDCLLLCALRLLLLPNRHGAMCLLHPLLRLSGLGTLR